MTLTDALAAAMEEYFGPSWWPGLTDVTIIAADTKIAAGKMTAAPAFREALTEVLQEALDAEEAEVGFTVYEAWPNADALVARILPAADPAADRSATATHDPEHE